MSIGTRRYWRGITYEELEGSPTFSFTRDSGRATQIIRVDWDDIDKLINDLFPRTLLRGTDWYYLTLPHFPRKSSLRVSECNVEPFDAENPSWDGTANTNRYESGAKVTIQYQTDSRDTEEDDEGDQTIRSHRVSVGGEALKLAQSGFYASDDPFKNPIKNEDVNVAKIIPTVEHTISFYYVPSPPFGTIIDKVGKVNSSANQLGVGEAIETMMFVGAEANKNVTSRGEDAWQLDYHFSQREVKEGSSTHGWNHVFLPDVGWQRLLSVDGDAPIYPSTSFTALFRNSG